MKRKKKKGNKGWIFSWQEAVSLQTPKAVENPQICCHSKSRNRTAGRTGHELEENPHEPLPPVLDVPTRLRPAGPSTPTRYLDEPRFRPIAIEGLACFGNGQDDALHGGAQHHLPRHRTHGQGHGHTVREEKRRHGEDREKLAREKV